MSANVLTRLTSYLPVEDHELFDLYYKARLTFWTEDEIDLTYDQIDWKTKLSETERTFMSYVLGFFVQSDQLVNINVGDRFLRDIENIPSKYRKPARLFYNFQVAIEEIHTLTYETMITELIIDPQKQVFFKNAIKNIPAVAQKADWAVRYTNDESSSFPIRLIAFAILEGIFFSGSFCAIFWMGKRNLLRGLVHGNKFISRDEQSHYEFALALFRKLRDDPNYTEAADPETIREMVMQAVQIESEFINESISCSMVGMNVQLMTKYIQFVADTLLQDIGMDPIYDSKNPFDFMIELGICEKANFFEQKDTVYQKAISGVLEYNSDSENDF